MYCLYYIRLFVLVFSRSSMESRGRRNSVYNGDYTRAQYHTMLCNNILIYGCEGLRHYGDASGRPVSTNIIWS